MSRLLKKLANIADPNPSVPEASLTSTKKESHSRPKWTVMILGVAIVVGLSIFIVQRVKTKKETPVLNPQAKQEMELDQKYTQVLGAIQSAQWGQAEVLLKEMILLRPNDWPLKTTLGMVLRQKGDLAEAQSLLTEVLKTHSATSVVHNNLAVVYLSKSDFNAAEEELQKAYTLDPNKEETLLNLGYLYEHKREWATAVRYYQEYLGQNGGQVRFAEQLTDRIRRLSSLSKVEKNGVEN